jgi:glycosyltransferase involved in cell wall biosynthesis
VIQTRPDHTQPPKVTIAIPTFNRAAYLQQAVDSALAQSYANIEILISDNASTDDTASVLQSFTDPRVRVLRQADNIGMMPNWNACLAAAGGAYFIMLSDDDLLDPTAIEAMVAMFEDGARRGAGVSSDEVGIVYAHARIIDETGTCTAYGKKAPRWEKAEQAVEAFFHSERHTFPCSILLRTADAVELGGYDARNYSLIADAQMWMKVAFKRGMVGFVDQTLVSYRVHAVSTTKTVRIQEWMSNNAALAMFCRRALEARGNTALAQAIERQVRHFNAGAAAALVEGSAGSGLARFTRFLRLSGNFLSIDSGPRVATLALKMILPAQLKQLARAASRGGKAQSK